MYVHNTFNEEKSYILQQNPSNNKIYYAITFFLLPVIIFVNVEKYIISLDIGPFLQLHKIIFYVSILINEFGFVLVCELHRD